MNFVFMYKLDFSFEILNYVNYLPTDGELAVVDKL